MNILWKKCLNVIEKQVLPESFSTWFSPLYPHSMENGRSVADGSLIISVPNEFFKKYLTENYLGLIESSLEAVAETKLKVSFFVNADGPPPLENHNQPERSQTELADGPLPGEDKYRETVLASSLNPKYTFPSFVVGSSNQFAHAAAKAVAANPAEAYNPLFLYGSVGLGKTHLLHAIGHAILKKNKRAKIRYISSEGFTVDLIQSIRKDNMNAFRERHRSLDVLLVDDIQFIAGKERTQEEFFYTFNTLYESHKQVVVTSDTYPKDMRHLEERMRSRFESGLIADIKPPDLETKVAILYKKLEQHKLEIPQDVALYIAGSVRSNIRELEGLLIRIVAYSSFTGKRIDMELTKEVLKDFTRDQTQNFTIPNIMKHAALYFNIKVSDLKSKRRSQDISIPRQIAMYICREYTKASLPEIGKQFGGKDHTTVIFSHKKIALLLKENNEISVTVQKLIQKIENL